MTARPVLLDGAMSCAILIGVHAYQLLDDLPAVGANLIALREMLTDPVLGSGGVA